MTISGSALSALPLEARAVSHQFNPNWWCLREVELAVRAGELVGLVGPNGSGKSTLMRILAAQLRPTQGEVRVGERPLEALAPRERARLVAWLPQHVRAVFPFSVEEVVAQGRYPHLGPLSAPGSRDWAIVREAMESTHTLAFAQRPFEILSGGERQLVLLASVLAQQTPFLLLDEPTSALDLHHQVDVFERVSAMAAAGLGVAVITHDLNLAARYCTRLVLLHEGRVIADGPPATVMNSETLRKVYDVELVVVPNPVTAAPMVVLRGGTRPHAGPVA